MPYAITRIRMKQNCDLAKFFTFLFVAPSARISAMIIPITGIAKTKSYPMYPYAEIGLFSWYFISLLSLSCVTFLFDAFIITGLGVAGNQ